MGSVSGQQLLRRSRRIIPMVPWAGDNALFNKSRWRGHVPNFPNVAIAEIHQMIIASFQILVNNSHRIIAREDMSRHDIGGFRPSDSKNVWGYVLQDPKYSLLRFQIQVATVG